MRKLLYIGLELSSACPLRCDFCPQGRGIIHRQNKFITKEIIELFITEGI